MIRLHRSLRVSSFDVEGTIALGRDRPEFLAVARLAADLDRPIGAHDVQRELLGKLPETLAWRVIERCTALGLLERREPRGPAWLSAAGRLALEHGQVLVPEEGVWRLFLSEDPLLHWRLVHAHRIEVGSNKSDRDEAQRGAGVQEQALPRALAEFGELPFMSLQSRNLQRIIHLAPRGTPGPPSSLRLTLTWAPEGTPEVGVKGELSNGGKQTLPVDASLGCPPALERQQYADLWLDMVATATQQSVEAMRIAWSKMRPLICPVRFANLDVRARQTFQREIKVPSRTYGTLGSFEPTTLERVDLVPASERDAEEWLHDLQWAAIEDYRTPSRLEQEGDSLLGRFPHHRPRPATPGQLLERAMTDTSEKRWFLLAPADLGLWSGADR